MKDLNRGLLNIPDAEDWKLVKKGDNKFYGEKNIELKSTGARSFYLVLRDDALNIEIFELASIIADGTPPHFIALGVFARP